MRKKFKGIKFSSKKLADEFFTAFINRKKALEILDRIEYGFFARTETLQQKISRVRKIIRKERERL